MGSLGVQAPPSAASRCPQAREGRWQQQQGAAQFQGEWEEEAGRC